MSRWATNSSSITPNRSLEHFSQSKGPGNAWALFVFRRPLQSKRPWRGSVQVSTRRQQQVSEFLREEISAIIQRELNDPRLGLVSITRVDMSPDLRYARAFVSVFGTEEEFAEALAALKGASGFIRHQLKPRMRVRHIPEITFQSDRSMQHADTITRALNEIKWATPATEATESSEEKSNGE
jgi:ribosome-binding factor A